MEHYEELSTFPLILKKINKQCKTTSRRFVTKGGNLNLQLTQVPKYKYLRFVKDFANTLVFIRWRWVIAIVLLANVFFYLCFTALFMFDAWFSGDLDPSKSGNFCIEATRHFTGYLLLSIETITTTGYGYLYPTENCRISWFILILNTVVIVLMDGIFISIVYVKITKPPRKDLTLFSKKSVVCLRNGKLCLIFRIYDHFERHMVGSSVSVFFLDKSEYFDVTLKELEVTFGGLLLWPVDIVHEINEASPLWNLSAKKLMENKFEIFVTVSGGSFITNKSSTSRTSYINEEIRWGFRFKSCMDYDEKFQRYVINENELFKVEPCDTPLCSASMLREIKLEITNEICALKDN